VPQLAVRRYIQRQGCSKSKIITTPHLDCLVGRLVPQKIKRVAQSTSVRRVEERNLSQHDELSSDVRGRSRDNHVYLGVITSDAWTHDVNGAEIGASVSLCASIVAAKMTATSRTKDREKDTENIEYLACLDAGEGIRYTRAGHYTTTA
jgi:hypothetical protein